MRKQAIKITVSILLIISVSLFMIPPKPVKAFVMAIPIAYQIALGVLVVATGVTVGTNDNFQYMVQNVFTKLSTGGQQLLQMAAEGAQIRNGSYAAEYSKEDYDSLQSEVSALVNQQGTTGITEYTSRYENYNGNEGSYTSATLPAHFYDRATSYSFPKTAGTYQENFLDNENNLTISYPSAGGTELSMSMPDGVTLKFSNSTYGVTTSGAGPFKIQISIVDEGTYKSAIFTGTLNVNASIFHEYGFTTILENYNINGTQRTGTLMHDITLKKVFIREGTYNYYIDEYTNIQSVSHFLHEYIYMPRNITTTQNADYVHGTGTKAISQTLADSPAITVPMPQTWDDLMELNPEAVTEYAETAAVPAPIDAVLPSEVPATDNPDVENMKLPLVIMNKFPFCIPYDLGRFIALLQATPVSPRWTIPIQVQSLGIDTSYEVNLDGFETVIEVGRWFILLAYIFGLILATRGIIKG